MHHGHTESSLPSATRLSQWDPWLSVPRLLVVWLYRGLVFLKNGKANLVPEGEICMKPIEFKYVQKKGSANRGAFPPDKLSRLRQFFIKDRAHRTNHPVPGWLQANNFGLRTLSSFPTHDTRDFKQHILDAWSRRITGPKRPKLSLNEYDKG
jgi:hypothetical protein